MDSTTYPSAAPLCSHTGSGTIRRDTANNEIQTFSSSIEKNKDLVNLNITVS